MAHSLQTLQIQASQTFHSFLFAILYFVASNAKAQLAGSPPYNICISNSKYTSGSPYETNLKYNLNSLTSEISFNGHSNRIIGTYPGTVYSLVQCIASIPLDSCRTCVSFSIEILRLCPTYKQAVIFYDSCMLHYGDTNFIGSDSPDMFLYLKNMQDSSDPHLFSLQLEKLMTYLSTRAASADSKFAAGKIRVTNSYIYGMVQCTKDLSDNSCLTCLQTIIMDHLSACCDKKEGARLYRMGCIIRYEMHSFLESIPFLEWTPGTSNGLSALPRISSPSLPPPMLSLVPHVPPMPSPQPPPSPLISTFSAPPISSPPSGPADKYQKIKLIIIVFVGVIGLLLTCLVASYIGGSTPC